MMDARETFSDRSDIYASSRPLYPTQLFAWIASQCGCHEKAWDCATGNGQAALGISPYFAHIEATDCSVEQVRHAFPISNVSYSVQLAEQANFPCGTFDLVTVAQALHWLDLKRFWSEVRRTSKSHAFFCAWAYDWFDCDPQLQAAFFAPVRELLEPYWAKEIGILWRGYKAEEIGFPFTPVALPSFAIEVNWDIQAILRYVETWSAYKRAATFPAIAQRLSAIEQHAAMCFASSGTFLLRSPLVMIAGYVA